MAQELRTVDQQAPQTIEEGQRSGRVEMWRSGCRPNISASAPFVLAVPHWLDRGSVSTSRSSNRTCRFPASGSRTRRHAFAHGSLHPRAVRRTRP